MSRGDGLARQLQLMQMLEHRQEIAVPEVAAELGYTVRTVYRDLQVLERVGVPIYQDRRGRRARWRVMEGYRRRLSVTLSWPEMLALVAARKMLEGVSAPALSDAAGSAVAKVHGALPREVAERAERFEAILSAQPGTAHDYRGKSEVLRTLIDAIERQESVRLHYRKPGERMTERLVDPYLLHVQAGALYLIGLCHQRNAVRTFLLDRVVEAARTHALFAARAPFAVLQGALGPWEGAPQRVCLRFEAEVAQLAAERRVHPTQTMQWRSDGGLDVELRAPICPPLLTWLMGWGGQVQIISPASLADRVRRAHERAAAPRGARQRLAAPAQQAKRHR
jgi:proteasome accessory factor B